MSEKPVHISALLPSIEPPHASTPISAKQIPLMDVGMDSVPVDPVHMDSPMDRENGQGVHVDSISGQGFPGMDREMDTLMDTQPGQGTENKRNPKILLEPKGVRTLQQKKLLALCQAESYFVTSYADLSRRLSIPYGTIRHILRKLAGMGLVTSKPYSAKGKLGLEIEYRGPWEPVVIAPEEQDVSAPSPAKSDTLFGQPLYKDKIDNKNPSLWDLGITEVREYWPHVAEAGLNRGHFHEVRAAFKDQKWALDANSEMLVAESLRYLDWQLEQGGITDKNGVFVSDPVAYWKKALTSKGYYQKPKGYVDLRQKAIDDLVAAKKHEAAQLRALQQAQKDEEIQAVEQLLERTIQELVEQGEQHPLWQAVYDGLMQYGRETLQRNDRAILATPILRGSVKATLRAKWGFTEPANAPSLPSVGPEPR